MKMREGYDISALIKVMGAIYAQIDERASEIGGALPLQCRKGCCGCCVKGLEVYRCEAAVIQSEFREIWESAPERSEGCRFLDDEGCCRIYRWRPYVCRTHGLPLLWRDGDNLYADICELNEGVGLDGLGEELFWVIGPVEEHLSKVEAVFFGDELKRVKF